MVKVTVNGTSIEHRICQPGQTPSTIGIALGYGRGEGGEAIGKAAFKWGGGDRIADAEGNRSNRKERRLAGAVDGFPPTPPRCECRGHERHAFLACTQFTTTWAVRGERVHGRLPVVKFPAAKQAGTA